MALPARQPCCSDQSDEVRSETKSRSDVDKQDRARKMCLSSIVSQTGELECRYGVKVGGYAETRVRE